MAEFSYSYKLPAELVANRPAQPRDAARLLAYDTKADEVHLSTFAELDRFLPPGSLMVLNDTKVVPARLELIKETGGRVEALFLVNEWAGVGPVKTLLDRQVKPGARLLTRRGRPFTVVRQAAKFFYVQPDFAVDELLGVLEDEGKTPVPKYIKGVDLPEEDLREEYQSIFGSTPASVAAPTASLHFTPEVLARLAKAGMKQAFVTLHVGLGTFAPLTAKNIQAGKLHEEYCRVPEETVRMVKEQKQSGRPVVAVGTTVVRALESQARGVRGGGWQGRTDIFIRPPFDFQVVEGLVTNFHLPETSLMMLVQALLAHKRARRSLVELYGLAAREEFRFYSFGDAMLVY